MDIWGGFPSACAWDTLIIPRDEGGSVNQCMDNAQQAGESVCRQAQAGFQPIAAVRQARLRLRAECADQGILIFGYGCHPYSSDHFMSA
ncbi:MAG: hypothetical protein HFG27_13365 [Provencibacterium sp.]|nr:hypothetical protein [Provencibacterium sp.]